jgi:hypothetical protein
MTYSSFRLSAIVQESQIRQTLVQLGTRERPTVWRVVELESTTSGEELITLKARGSLGVLPEIEAEKIIDRQDRAKVSETIEKLVDTVHRAGPESVVDNARNAASAIMLAALRQHGMTVRAKDLSDAATKFERERNLSKFGIVPLAARIVARLHPRSKPSERERREGIPVIREQDGELAVLCVGTILRDLGWATWS